LTAAARRILEREGYDALSLRAAARGADVSQAAPYHHFADKEALLAAVAAQGFDELTAAMLARMAPATAPAARLDEAGIAYVCFAVANPALFRLMFAANLSGDAVLAQAGARAYGILKDAVAATLSAEGDDAQTLQLASLSAWSKVHGLAKLILEAGVKPADYGFDSVQTLAAALLTRNA
jgi:AcrR family transcriptional regulator